METDGSFDVAFSETVEAFIGRVIKEGRVTEQMVTDSKLTWELIFREGIGIVGIHIPCGAKITKENFHAVIQ